MTVELDFKKHDSHYIAHNIKDEIQNVADLSYRFENERIGPAYGAKVANKGCEEGYRARYCVSMPDADIHNVEVDFRIFDSSLDRTPDRTFATVVREPSEHRTNITEDDIQILYDNLKTEIDSLVDAEKKEEHDVGLERVVEYSWGK